ncbi:hypothetical protein [Thalassobacillus sp. C254]|uniref:hypothetical protein n=1 Tax=Thalassobacillus sp. C254 TaxID=1225341 RepID=UPI0006CFDC3D|nr:hypothetical protein [Thalassobacillus sp. C254]
MSHDILQQVDLKEFETLPIGTRITADIVSYSSGQNKIKGIHPLKINDQIKAVIILCTIGGENYPNEWLNEEKTILKYYLEGRKDKTTERKNITKI